MKPNPGYHSLCHFPYQLTWSVKLQVSDPLTGLTTVTDIASSKPLSFRATRVRDANGHPNDTYR